LTPRWEYFAITREPMNRLRGVIFALGLIAVALSLRAPFLKREVWNLDEASTFTMAQQVVEGGVLYRDAADNRSPLVPYLKAAVFAVAGDWNAFAVHLLLALGMGVAAILIWRIAARLGDQSAGIWAAVFFTLVSFLLLDPIDTLTAHTGWFLIFFSITGFWLFARAITRPTFGAGTAIGVLFGLSTLCKQPGILDFAVTFVLVSLLALESPARKRDLTRLLAGQLSGFAVVIALAIAYFAANGALEDLYFYAWVYNTRYYVPEVPLLDRMAEVHRPFFLAALHFPVALVAGVLGAIGLVTRAFAGLRKPVRIDILAWLILGWTGAGLLSTMLSGRQFSHYNIQVLPGLSLACGWFAARAVVYFRNRGRLMRVAGAVLLIVAFVSTGLALRNRNARLDPEDDFSKDVAKVVIRNSRKDEPILVWGYYPEYYFYSKRLPSTRFIYTNYLTGLIPWTNLDPLTDTSYASIPGGWDQFWADFERRPPAVIINTGDARGYLKYPLHKQGRLWTTVIRDYAAVEEAATRSYGVRIYRRLAVIESGEKAPTGTVSDSVRITDSTVQGSNPRIIALTIHAPAGVTSVELLRGDSVFKRVDHVPDVSCDVMMLVDPADLLSGSVIFRAAVHTKDGVLLSYPMDVAASYRDVQRDFAVGPEISFGTAKIPAIDGEAANGPMTEMETSPGFWRAHAPSRLVFRRPLALRSLTFKYGVEPGSYNRADGQGSDGVDFLVTLEQDDGKVIELFRRRLNPGSDGSHQGLQTGEASLPRNVPGRLVFRTLAGRLGDPTFDWGFWGELTGESVGPCIEFGMDQIAPVASVTPGDGIMFRSEAGQWIAHAPSRLEYARDATMHAVIFSYGIQDAAFDSRHQGVTDGYSVSLSITLPDGGSEVLYERKLDPVRRAEDRGTQTVRVPFPNKPFDRFVLRLDPGPNDNTAFDWTYFTTIQGQGFGPDIELDDGKRLAPFEGTKLETDRIELDITNGRWLSHAPARLAYRIPPGLTAVTFGFGLDERVYADEKGGPMSDGVDVLVFLEQNGAAPREIFRRRMNPYKEIADWGPQSARVELPVGASGNLVFVMGPGPDANNGYDWAYWTGFHGETVPPR